MDSLLRSSPQLNQNDLLAIREKIEKVVCAREINGLPSIRRAAMEVLALIKQTSSTQQTQNIRLGTNEIADANISIVRDSLEEGSVVDENWDGVAVLKETLRQKGYLDVADVGKLLGYEFEGVSPTSLSGEGMKPMVGPVHMQRMGDILGPQVGGFLDG